MSDYLYTHPFDVLLAFGLLAPNVILVSITLEWTRPPPPHNGYQYLEVRL